MKRVPTRWSCSKSKKSILLVPPTYSSGFTSTFLFVCQNISNISKKFKRDIVDVYCYIATHETAHFHARFRRFWRSDINVRKLSICFLQNEMYCIIWLKIWREILPSKWEPLGLGAKICQRVVKEYQLLKQNMIELFSYICRYLSKHFFLICTEVYFCDNFDTIFWYSFRFFSVNWFFFGTMKNGYGEMV